MATTETKTETPVEKRRRLAREKAQAETQKKNADKGKMNPDDDAELNRRTVKEYMAEMGFIQVNAKVAQNVNEYPFVTFIDADNKAENVYFSKNASALVEEGDDIVKGFFDDFCVVDVINADGEKRTKIATKGGNRIDIDDLF